MRGSTCTALCTGDPFHDTLGLDQGLRYNTQIIVTGTSGAGSKRFWGVSGVVLKAAGSLGHASPIGAHTAHGAHENACPQLILTSYVWTTPPASPQCADVRSYVLGLTPHRIVLRRVGMGCCSQQET